MWKGGRYTEEHTYDMDTFRKGHFNLNVEMIASFLYSNVEKMPRYYIILKLFYFNMKILISLFDNYVIFNFQVSTEDC